MASPKSRPDFLFVDGQENRRRGIQSFINSRRLKDKASRRNLTIRSKAPVGWAEQPHSSSDLPRNDLTRREIPSGLLAAPQTPSDTTSEYTDSLGHPSPAPSPSTALEYSLVRTQSRHSLLDSIERELTHVDPFANLPLQLDQPSQALYRFSIAFLTEDQFGTSFQNPTLTKSLGLWPHYNSAIRVCATLLQASAYIDRVSRAGTSDQTVKWKFNLLQCLNRVISDEATRYGDDALNGVMLLLLFEFMTPGSEQTYLHSRALMQLLSRRGIHGCLSDHIDVALAILTSKAQVAYLDHLPPGQAGVDEVYAWRGEVDFTVETLRGLSKWVLQTPRTFYCNSILNNSVFLKSIQNFATPADIFELSQQTFALCYIAVALWDIRDVPGCIHFLQTLSVRHDQLGSDRPLPNTVWVCIRGTDDNPDLQFQAIRLVRIFHRLTHATQSVLRQFLTRLCGVVNGSSVGVILAEEDYASVSREALVGLPFG